MFELDGNGRFPMFNIDFFRIIKIGWETRVVPGDRLSDDYSQWTRMDSKQTKSNGITSIWFWGTAPSRELNIDCKDVTVSSTETMYR